MRLRWPARPSIRPFREGTFRSRLHDDRNAALLGAVLGVGFVVCFLTGLLSHLIQDPPGWFRWPARPAGLYRVTQGTHVVLGIALIPVLLAKLWTVYPKLFEWPPFDSAAQLVERLMLLPLIGGGLFLVFTGVGNINIWRPWSFGFRPGHYWAAWITIGALVTHTLAKWATTRDALLGRLPPPPATVASEDRGLSRRGFLTATFGAAGALVLFSAGQSWPPLERLALVVPRRPKDGPQGLAINRTAASVDLEQVDLERYRLVVDGPAAASPFELDYDELRELPQHEATLPIACVEGWSAEATWRGVRVRDLLAMADAPDDCTARVVSMQESPRLRSSDLNRSHAHDPDTLLALEVNGEPLVADHGFPLRLIGPNRPGVMQTKWVNHVEAL